MEILFSIIVVVIVSMHSHTPPLGFECFATNIEIQVEIKTDRGVGFLPMTQLGFSM